MIRKVCSFILALVMVSCLFTGCSDTVSEIAGNVADAAVAELEKQVKSALEKNKVEVVEMKSVFGKLNDQGSEAQLFCAALIRAESTDLAKAAVDTMGKLVTQAGIFSQTGSTVSSDLLVHKKIQFKHTDFSAGNYYVIFAYHEDLSANMPSLGGK